MKRTFIKAIASAALLIHVASSVAHADFQPRIIGGSNVNINAFPSTVALISNSILDNQNSLFQAQTCGGTLISSTWVLTAAHCVVDNAGKVIPASEYSILAGSSDLTAPVTSTIQVARIIVHKDYRQVVFGDDIALLQLAAESSAPAIAMNDTQLPADQNTFIVGWGTVDNINEDGSGSFPRLLQSAVVPTVDGSDCANLPGNYQFVDANSQICAGFAQGGVDSCSGDSGGPLYSVSKDSSLKLAGITNWGNGCALANQPGIYTDVLAYKSWIEEMMSDNTRPVDSTSENPRKPDETLLNNPDIRSSSADGGASLLFLPLLLLCFRFKSPRKV